jgi:hypothetical protein
MKINKDIELIKDRFSNKKDFERKELFDFFKEKSPKFSESNFKWKIRQLKMSGIIFSVKRGLFKIASKNTEYNISINEDMKSINNVINEHFNDALFCLWESQCFNEFSRHQASSGSIFVEVEKELVELVFHRLLDNNFENVYLNPNRNVVNTYVSENFNSIIVKTLPSRSPLQTKQNIKVPKLEKLLVDLFCDKFLLLAYQGYEMLTVFENAFSEYEINYTTLLNYSKRRKKEKELKEFLLKNIKIAKEYIL